MTPSRALQRRARRVRLGRTPVDTSGLTIEMGAGAECVAVWSPRGGFVLTPTEARVASRRLWALARIAKENR